MAFQERHLKLGLTTWLLVGVSLFGSALAWAAHLLVSYFLVPFSCTLDTVWLLHATTAVTALASLGSAWLAWRLRLPRLGDEILESRDVDRLDRFLSRTGVMMGVFFCAVIVVEGLPVFFIHPCQL